MKLQKLRIEHLMNLLLFCQGSNLVLQDGAGELLSSQTSS